MTATLALRIADEDDAHALRRLAQLDDARALTGEILVAVLDGEPVAALSLADDRVIANPFVRTADVVSLLRMRAAHISPGLSRAA